MTQIEAVIRHFDLALLPPENVLFRQTYCSAASLSSGRPMATAIIGIYCERPLSLSLFHRLRFDEVWHFYDGDLFELHLLYDNGQSQTVIMGRDWQSGQKLQFVVPAGVWQGGCIIPGGTYSLFGTTMTPGFTSDCFEIGTKEDLLKRYPDKEAVIRKLT